MVDLSRRAARRVDQEASCFTFVHGLAAAEVVRHAAFQDVQGHDLSGDPDAADRFQDEGVAVFDAGNGWSVVYQDNGYPEQCANPLAESGASQVVVVFWNVNSVTEFAYWSRGTQLVRFEFPDEIDGSEPNRLADDMNALGITGEAYERDPQTYYARLMALAESITGIHLGPDFLQRRLYTGRVSDRAATGESGSLATAPKQPTGWLIENYDPELAAALASATPQSQQTAQDYLVDEVLRFTGLQDEPAALAAAHRLSLGQRGRLPDDLILLISRLDSETPPMRGARLLTPGLAAPQGRRNVG